MPDLAESKVEREENAMAGPLALDRDAISALCERYGVKRLVLFGSAVTDRFDGSSSDVGRTCPARLGPWARSRRKQCVATIRARYIKAVRLGDSGSVCWRWVKRCVRLTHNLCHGCPSTNHVFALPDVIG
jgi:hypothetical protein